MHPSTPTRTGRLNVRPSSPPAKSLGEEPPELIHYLYINDDGTINTNREQELINVFNLQFGNLIIINGRTYQLNSQNKLEEKKTLSRFGGKSKKRKSRKRKSRKKRRRTNRRKSRNLLKK